MSNKKVNMSNLMAGLLGAIVENKSLDAALKEVGLSENALINQLVAPQSSGAAIDYVKESIAEKISKYSRDEDSNLYLVKKVLCESNDYKGMSKAVSEKSTEKFQVLRLISSDPKTMKYKQETFGLEGYLVSAKTPLEAMKVTATEEPVFYFSSDNFDTELARKFDKLFTDAIYKHTPKSIEKIMSMIKTDF